MDKTYLLGEGAAAVDRLALVQRIYGSRSRAGLLAGGPLSGRRVLELGCGTGGMSQWLAEQVGPEGCVVATDTSEAQLNVARARCAGLGNLRIERRDATDTELPPGSFDLVYARLLLMHVPRPLDVLRHAYQLLRPGGALVCEEAAIDSTFADPALPEQAELHALANQMARERGCDYNVARRLSSLVRQAGFHVRGVSAQQPVALRGPEKLLETESFAEALAHWQGASAAALTTGAQIVAALRRSALDDNVTYGLSMMMQVRATKEPAA